MPPRLSLFQLASLTSLVYLRRFVYQLCMSLPAPVICLSFCTITRLPWLPFCLLSTLTAFLLPAVCLSACCLPAVFLDCLSTCCLNWLSYCLLSTLTAFLFACLPTPYMTPSATLSMCCLTSYLFYMFRYISAYMLSLVLFCCLFICICHSNASLSTETKQRRRGSKTVKKQGNEEATQ